MYGCPRATRRPTVAPVDALTLVPVDGVRITTLVDNCSDMLLPDVGLVRRWGLAGTGGAPAVVPAQFASGGTAWDLLRAEHGFSALVEIHHDGATRRILFDAGASRDCLVDNLDRLGLPCDGFEAVVISHGHVDHVMGLEGLARRIGRRHLPVVLHPEAWTRRRLVSPSGSLELPTLSRQAVEGAGFAVVEGRRPSFLLDDRLLVTGEVERVTDFETGMPPAHEAWRDGGWQPDRLVHDDQAVVLNVRDRGLVILTGCGHAGIVNIIRQSTRTTGISRVHAICGGLHLRSGPVVERTVAELVAVAPAAVVAGHCTSWEAQRALASALPAAFLPNAVGSTFVFTGFHEVQPEGSRA